MIALLLIASLGGTPLLESADYYTARGPVSLAPATDVLVIESTDWHAASRLAAERVTTHLFGGRLLFSDLSDAERSVLLQALAEQGLVRQVLAPYRLPGGELMIADQKIRAGFPPSFAAADVRRIAEAHGAVDVRPLRPAQGLYEILSATPQDTLQVAERLHLGVGATWAHPDFIYRKQRNHVPSDPLFSDQWHHDIIGSAAAWDIEMGDPAVIIAIIDSGTDLTHPDLEGRLVEPYDALYEDDDPTPDPYDAHGTGCAGLAGAIIDNAIGVAGVCGECSIMPIRIMSESQYGRMGADTDAFYHAADNGAAVLSNSWGMVEAVAVPTDMDQAIAYVVEDGRDGLGALIMFASGNDYRENFSYELASHPLVLGIGATTYWEEKEDYSNWAAELDFTAPAASVTTDIQGDTGYASGDYVYGFGGTSAATPVAAGVAGLVFSVDPTFTSGQVLGILTDTADEIGDVVYTDGHHPWYGNGRVNALRAVQMADDPTSVCQPDPAGEDCEDTIDNDCDGLIDEIDTSCAPDEPNIGGYCTQDYQCGQDAMCLTVEWGFDGGYCTTWCEDSTNCLGDAVCAPMGHWGFCAEGCTAREDCREGYDCLTLESGDQGCLPSCTVAPCDTGELCNETTGRCYHDGPSPGGGHCFDDFDCANDAYCNPGFEGGFCVDTCWEESDCADDGATVCGDLGYRVGFCLPFCMRSDQCRDGFACQSDDSGGGGYCVPECRTSGDCDGAVCNSDGLCGTAEPPLPALPPDECTTNGCSDPEICDLDTDDCYHDGASLPAGACTEDNDCAEDAACTSIVEGGFCFLPCSSGDECGDESICQGVNEDWQFCTQFCTRSQFCREGFVCQPKTGGESGGFCVPGCTADGACSDSTCNEFGLCGDAEPPLPDVTLTGGSGGDGGAGGAGGVGGGVVGGAGGDGGTGGDGGDPPDGGCVAAAPSSGMPLLGLLLLLWRRTRR